MIKFVLAGKKHSTSEPSKLSAHQKIGITIYQGCKLRVSLRMIIDFGQVSVEMDVMSGDARTSSNWRLPAVFRSVVCEDVRRPQWSGEALEEVPDP